MDAGLIRGFEHRFIFVVGKGGVGKTTCAGALALAGADAGIATLLVSTDPAHSIGDLFGLPLEAGRLRAACGAPLALEEFNGPAYARAWLAEYGPALADLLERGTYLRPEQSRALLEPASPGVDEVMAALRLAELALRTDLARVVVDTAPTGHTLRLLDAGTTVRSWLAALEALADKAGAVAAALVRQPIRFAAEELIEHLETSVRRFEDEVLASAAFLTVTRDDPLVLAETARLRAELDARGLGVVAELRVGATERQIGVWPVRWQADTSGCAGLRELVDPVRTVGVASPQPLTRRPARSPAAERAEASAEAVGRVVAGRRVLLFAGKGGVGKSTCAAAVAAGVSRRRSVRLYSIDPAGSLEEVLDRRLQPGGEPVGERILACQVDAGAELDRLREAYRERAESIFARMGLSGTTELDRAVAESLWNLAPPGMDELAAMAVLLDRTGYGEPREAERERGEPPLTIIDAAPTGHFLRLLELPGTALEWVHALMRALLDHHPVVGLDAAGEPLLRLSKRLRILMMALSDPGWTGTFVVSLPEPMVAAETARLLDRLSRAGVPLAALICNRSGQGAACGAGRAPTIAAPSLDPPPRGLPELARFFDLWHW